MSDRDLYESEALERAGLAWEAIAHCGSCHDDADMGYSMNGVTFAADERDAEVCCEAALRLDAIDGLTIRPDWWKPVSGSVGE